MTAEIVPLPERKPRVVGIVNDPGVRPPDPRSLAIERCVDRIERSMRTRLTIEERIGLERALDELVDEVQWRSRDLWC